MQQTVSEAHHEMLLQSCTVRRILLSSPSTSAGMVRSNTQHSWLPWHLSGGFLRPAASTTLAVNESILTVDPMPISGQKESPSIQCRLQNQTALAGGAINSNGALTSSRGLSACTSPRPMAAPEPASPFEVLNTFFPETYTTDQRFPASVILAIDSYEVSHSSETRTNVYRLSYLKSRQWRMINVSISIQSSSSYWAVTELSQSGHRGRDILFPAGVPSLPSSLLAQVQGFLSNVEGLDDYNLYRFSLKNQTIIEDSQPEAQFRSLPSDADVWASLDILSSLGDLGCPRYPEEEVTQIEAIDSPAYFASCVGGTLVYEVRFYQGTSTLELLYNIQLLRSMENVPGFAKFVGIVTNNSGKRLRSYLVEFLWTRCLFLKDALSGTKGAQVIPWERRQHWARQIIEAVRHAHCKGFVIGTLGLPHGYSLLVDHSGCVRLWRFRNKFMLGRSAYYYPPEFRHLRDATPSTRESDYPNITPKTDIYHLGLALWYLAERFPREPRANPACIRAGCIQFPHRCNEFHKSLCTLPPLSSDIPQYYRNIVDMCTTVDPLERPAAWELLEMFPSASEYECAREEALIPGSMDLALLEHGSLKITWCNHCRRCVGRRYSHCNVCLAGDFDICEACFSKGLHCYDVDHLLVELEKPQFQHCTMTGRYYSRVKDSGARDVTKL